jgi:hypothetical protein
MRWGLIWPFRYKRVTLTLLQKLRIPRFLGRAMAEWNLVHGWSTCALIDEQRSAETC